MVMMVLVTIPKAKAKAMTKLLLKKRVCACVNIISNVESFFWWQGKLNAAKEALLIIKTKKSLFSKVKGVIKANHPYKVAEIIGFEIDKINSEYSRWLDKEACG